MDAQLKRLSEECPMFISTVENAILSAYRKADDYLVNSQSYGKRRYGYGLLLTVEPTVDRAVREMNFPGFEVICAPNTSNTAIHLEIHTPYGVFMVVRVSRSGAVPPKVEYRQRFIDQTFMQEAQLGFELYSPDCIPLYIISHFKAGYKNETPDIRIGRLDHLQNGWSCNHPISVFKSEEKTHEQIDGAVAVAPKEEISKATSIRVKRAQ